MSVEQMFSRDLGLWSIEEKRAMNNSVVSIVGAGGDGGRLAEELTRAGVGEIRQADPQNFDWENLNRQAFSNEATVGRNKAEVVAEGVQAIRRKLKVVTYPEGITQLNIGAFLKGADLVIDESEFTMPELGVMTAQAARAEGIPNVMAMNIGFAGTVTSFDPTSKRTFEAMIGLPDGIAPEDVVGMKIPIKRWLPYLPPYADLQMFERVARGEVSAPSVSIGVSMAAGVAATQACLWLTRGINNNRPKPITAPRTRVMDAMTGEGHDVRMPIMSYYMRLAAMSINNARKRVPKVTY